MIIYLKDKKEIEGFKKAGKIAAEIMTILLENVKEGTTTNQLNEIAILECEKRKVKPAFLGHEGFPAAICASPNNVLVHGVPDDVPLKNYDLLSIDIGVDVDGFIGDTAETISVGENLENDLLILACQQALLAGIGFARAGNQLSEIGKAVSAISRAKKYAMPTGYGGHGINRGQLHADPFVANDPEGYEDVMLRPGMVIAIEPMFINGDPSTRTLEDEWTVTTGGKAAHCEHTILITEKDPVVLTNRE